MNGKKRKGEMMKRIMPVWCLAAVFLAASSMSAWAQMETLLDFGATFVGESENDDDNITTEIQRTLVWARGTYPIRLQSGNAIILGAEYEGQFIDYDEVNTLPTILPIVNNLVTENDLPDDLHAVDVSLGYLHRWSEQWSTIFQFRPGIHSDFEDISGDDFVWGGMILVQKRLKGKNRAGVGVVHSDSFGDTMFFPVVLFNYYRNEQWFIESLLPMKLDAGYNVSSSFTLGLEGRLKGYQYRLTEEKPWEDSVLQYREVRVGPYVTYAFHEKAHLRVSSGVVLAQKFELNDDDNDKKLLDGDFENTGYITVKLYVPF
jgi:hypothetical protein